MFDISKYDFAATSFSGTTISQEPVITIQEVKEFLKVDFSDEDYTLEMLLNAAVEQAEKFTSLVIKEAGYVVFAEGIIRKLALPIAPISSILSVNEILSDGTKKTLVQNTDFYITGTFQKTLNFLSDTERTIEIICKAGYISLPENLKHIILKISATNYEYREDIHQGSVMQLDNSSKKLLSQYRIF